LTETIKAIFLIRSQPLIRFSRSIALWISSKRSKYTRRFELIFRGEAGTDPHFVLTHPADQIVGNARVESLRPVGHDVDEVCFGGAHRRDSFRFLKDGGVAVSVSVTSEHRFPQVTRPPKSLVILSEAKDDKARV
jgi:hypothetical protein